MIKTISKLIHSPFSVPRKGLAIRLYSSSSSSSCCPHVSSLSRPHHPFFQNPLSPSSSSSSSSPSSPVTASSVLCQSCHTTVAPKLCMHCYLSFCGRTAGSHSLAHHTVDHKDHPISASLDSLNFWCFSCDRLLTDGDKDSQGIIMDAFKEMYRIVYSKECTATSMKEALQNTTAFPHVDIQRPSFNKEDLLFDVLKLPPNASTLSRSQLKDKIKGVIYGSCAGDAIGLLTEYMTKETAVKSYGNKPLEYVMDNHRKQIPDPDWTDDSDQMILILESLLHCKGEINSKDFGKRLIFWAQLGFPELGDTSGAGLGWTVKQVLQHREFLERPSAAAREVWINTGKSVAANGAVMRTCILGIPFFYDMERVISNTIEICKVTHADPRCIASCVAVTATIAQLLQGKHDIIEVCKLATEIGKKGLPSDQITEFEQYMNPQSLLELNLDENGKVGYTYKALGSAFYAFRNENDFRKAITDITMEGGDADSNAVVTGALLGAKNGFSSLPTSWINNLKHKEWLDKRVNAFLVALGL